MFRIIKYIFLAILAVLLLTVALANRELITLRLLTPELEGLLGFSYALSLPVYAVVLGSVALGLLIGFIWEWIRESKHRSEVAKRQDQVRSLKREMIKMKGEAGDQKDDVLAILENPNKKAS